MSIKAVIFDFDGTISFQDYCTWKVLWAYLGDEKLDKYLVDLYYSGKITNEEWETFADNHFINKKLTKKQVMEAGNNIKLLNDVHCVFEKLHESGVEIYILSAGIKTMIKQSLGDSEKYVNWIESTDFKFDENEIYKGRIKPETDIHDKGTFISKFLQEKDFNVDEILFIGNDSNDECVSKYGIRTLCINPYRTNGHDKSIWTDCIESTESLHDIMQYV